MRKLAIFVEGHTELVFVTQLLLELNGYMDLAIERRVLRGKLLIEVSSRGAPPEDSRFHVLVMNCECDGKVRSAILERVEGLARQGFDAVLGLRDVYPLVRGELDVLRNSLGQDLNRLPIPAKILVAVMEIESWFLAEASHFRNVHPSLTPGRIAALIGFNPETDDPEDIPHPSALLDEIYRSVGASYRKRQRDAERIAARLDYESMCVNTRLRSPSFAEFLGQLEDFLTD